MVGAAAASSSPKYKAFVVMAGAVTGVNNVIDWAVALDANNPGKIKFAGIQVSWFFASSASSNNLSSYNSMYWSFTVDNGPVPQMYAQIKQQAADMIRSFDYVEVRADIPADDVLVIGGPSLF